MNVRGWPRSVAMSLRPVQFWWHPPCHSEHSHASPTTRFIALDSVIKVDRWFVLFVLICLVKFQIAYFCFRSFRPNTFCINNMHSLYNCHDENYWVFHTLSHANKKLSYSRSTARRAMSRNSWYVSHGMGVRKVSNIKSDLQGHWRALAMVPFDRPHTISY